MAPLPARHRPPKRPESQECKGKDKGELALKKARRSSLFAPLVSESDTEESDTEESETEVGGIASRVRHSRPYYQHISDRQERAQGERKKEKAHRRIQERRDYDGKLFVNLMRRHKRTTGYADD